jgi:ABC-type tungstate transport system substrate-binding protein
LIAVPLTFCSLSGNQLVTTKSLKIGRHIDVGETIKFDGQDLTVTIANGENGGNFTAATFDGIFHISQALKVNTKIKSVK